MNGMKPCRCRYGIPTCIFRCAPHGFNFRIEYKGKNWFADNLHQPVNISQPEMREEKEAV